MNASFYLHFILGYCSRISWLSAIYNYKIINQNHSLLTPLKVYIRNIFYHKNFQLFLNDLSLFLNFVWIISVDQLPHSFSLWSSFTPQRRPHWSLPVILLKQSFTISLYGLIRLISKFTILSDISDSMFVKRLKTSLSLECHLSQRVRLTYCTALYTLATVI